MARRMIKFFLFHPNSSKSFRNLSWKASRSKIQSPGRILGAVTLAGLGAAAAIPAFFPKLEAAKKFEEAGNDAAGPLTRSQRFNFIADVVERASPAVVYIEIQGRHPYTGENVTMSNGSGFIVKEDGLVLTNAHVVANKPTVLVKLHDGRVFKGRVEDIDHVSDLATIRIDCKHLPTLRLGSSAKARPGEWVVAMGSPLSLSNTITAGVISAVHRGSKELGLRKPNIDYIQTDASITFGNSGGPLVNLDGEVIGINTMKVTPGISFAVTADHVKQFLETAEANRKARASGSGWFGFGHSSQPPDVAKRRYIGVTMLTLTPDLILELQQRQSNFPPNVQHGVLIWKVTVGSPAHKSGLTPGDVVTEIDGKTVNSATDVYNALKCKDKLTLNVVRKREKRTVIVMPEDANL